MSLRGVFLVATAAAALAAGCGQARPASETKQYQLTGQILDVRPEKLEVLVRHDEIAGFMAAMTMPYKVRDAALLKDREPGDLFTATLVVSDSLGVLTTLSKTGTAPIVLPTPQPVANPATTTTNALTEGSQIPDISLTDQAGRTRRLSSLGGHRLVITFMYTTCPMPDYCPLLDKHFASLQGTLAQTPALDDVRLVSITIDPSVDTPAVLAAHAAKVKANPAIWRFYTGDGAAIGTFAGGFGLSVVRNDKDLTDISHTLRTLIVTGDGRLAKVRTGNSWTPADILADLATVPAPAR